MNEPTTELMGIYSKRGLGPVFEPAAAESVGDPMALPPLEATYYDPTAQ